jgi:hypothetical protein
MILLYEGDTMSLIGATKDNCQHIPLESVKVGKVLTCAKCGCQLNFYNPPAGTHKRMSKKERRKMAAKAYAATEAKFRAAMLKPAYDSERREHLLASAQPELIKGEPVIQGVDLMPFGRDAEPNMFNENGTQNENGSN